MDPEPKVQSETSNSTVVIPQSKVTKPENPSQYIRTFAKDAARLSGQPVPAPIPVPVKTHPAPINEYIPAISFTEHDTSTVEGEKAGSKRDIPEEVLHTTKEDEKGVFEETPKVMPVPLMSENPAPLPVIVPPTLTESVATAVVTETVPEPASGVQLPTYQTDESETRDGILARLRAKINSSQQSAPLEKHAGEMNLLQSQADLGKELPAIPTRENVEPTSEPFVFPVTLPQPKPEPVPEPLPVVKEEVQASASPLHTYSSDFADRIDERSATAFSVLAAELDAAPVRTTTTVRVGTSSSIKWRLALAGVLLVAGIGVATASIMFFANSSNLPLAGLTTPSLVTFDDSAEITDTGSGYMSALAQKASESLPQGNVLVTYISISTSSSLGVVKTPQPGGVLIAKLATNAPEIFLRNASPDSTVGIIHAGGQTRAFFIFNVTSYERTFAGMLTWEQSIASDLALLYPAYPEETTSSTTVGISTANVSTARSGFVDTVVANHDVRVFKDRSNRTVLLYGYKDKNTLIVARDEAAFSALIARLSSGSTK